MATRNPYEVGGEPCYRQLAPSGAMQRQRRAINLGFRAGSHATTGPAWPSSRCVIARSAARGSVAIILLRTRAARWADRAALQDRQRTTRRPRGSPPRATSRTWSAVRSADGWAGRRSHPGHQSPTMARWSATTRRRRSRSAASLCRSGRRTRLSWSRWLVQSAQRGLPRTCRPQPRQGRSRLLLIGACGVGARLARACSVRIVRPRRCGACRTGNAARLGCANPGRRRHSSCRPACFP
jgi:hypothetical protein